MFLILIYTTVLIIVFIKIVIEHFGFNAIWINESKDSEPAILPLL
ncbi:MAG: hypothetical protein BWY89_00888 [Bacteroidetes bacterium ADurb.BinA012]|jgi:hypothetical protein|nr:MAG: hypothetical protein BWY89_00888 [Bacteroidetes bacterium ADurb.BinA012]